VLKTRYFASARELTVFVNDADNHVGTVLSITFDAQSMKFVIFYYEG
jgi:hypothetical protein